MLSAILLSLPVVRMFWWFLMVAVAAGAVLWAALSAYVKVRERWQKTQNRLGDARRQPEAHGEHSHSEN
jgi:hypothetical protein